MNHSNKGVNSSAESGEGRPLIKENVRQPNTSPTQSGERVSQGLAGVRKAARNPDLLDAYSRPGRPMAPSTASAPSLPRGSLCRQSSAIRTGCA